MYWCDEHKQDSRYCANFHSAFPEVKEVTAQMSFGDFETVLSIIEKATEKDIEDIVTMIHNRKFVLQMLKKKKEDTK